MTQRFDDSFAARYLGISSSNFDTTQNEISSNTTLTRRVSGIATEVSPSPKQMNHQSLDSTSNHSQSSYCDDQSTTNKPNAILISFPFKLHRMLNNAEDKGFQHIVSWHHEGKAFKIRDTDAFEKQVMPSHFASQTKYKSFQRQLNLYDFKRITVEGEGGYYFHEHFMRNDTNRCIKMKVQKIKGKRRSSKNSSRGKKSPNQEPSKKTRESEHESKSSPSTKTKTNNPKTPPLPSSTLTTNPGDHSSYTPPSRPPPRRDEQVLITDDEDERVRLFGGMQIYPVDLDDLDVGILLS